MSQFDRIVTLAISFLFFLNIPSGVLIIRGAVEMPEVARGHQRAAVHYKSSVWSSVCPCIISA